MANVSEGGVRMAAEHIFGSHTVDNGGIDMAVYRAAAAGLRAVQVFTAIPKFYGDRSSIREERVARFRAAQEETGIGGRNVVVHAAYVLNTANADAEKRERAHAGLEKELERSTAIGAGGVCFHPGSAGKGDVGRALAWVSEAITRALESVDPATKVWVENTAGAGATVGRTAEEVGAILDGVPSSLRKRTGYGLDTCHLFSAGYDIAHSREVLTSVLDAFEAATGEAPAFFHLNDSRFPMGSNRDRHALLGEGEMGEAPFRWLLEDRRSRGIPLILETPQLDYDIGKEDRSADPYDVRMRELLERLDP
ncbi:MAG TPA: deoxyribonuclease IV [Longimicrobiales bacterium]|nr:deoxyribonuclease IV [Longimicrobiales bacterium]